MADEERKALNFLLERMYDILKKYQIHVYDYTGEKYIEGMNGIEVMSVEANSETDDLIIGESINPVLEIDGKIVQRSKVIIKNTSSLSELKNTEKVTITSKNNISGCETRRKCAKNLAKFLGFAFFWIIWFLLWLFVNTTKEPKGLEQLPIIEIVNQDVVEDREDQQKLSIEIEKYSLNFTKIVQEQNVTLELLEEIQGFPAYDLFEFLGLRWKEDSQNFGIMPWSYENNLKIKNLFLEELFNAIKQ